MAFALILSKMKERSYFYMTRFFLTHYVIPKQNWLA
ncbi:hypothetical protein SAMN05444149_103791 [Pseudosulfitobacter pseudonitzschiae]|nr:hypothetical protein SAMN05444149_103791 [Pseudosulfitobacter pseudonitzschiae]